MESHWKRSANPAGSGENLLKTNRMTMVSLATESRIVKDSD